MKYIKSLLLASICFLSIILLPLNIYAAVKTISSVSLRITHDVEVGDYLEDVGIYIGENQETGIGVSLNNASENKYYISNASMVNTSSKALKIGDEIKIKVTLTPLVVEDTEYEFKGTYNKNNVNVSGGEFVSGTKSNGELTVTLRLKGLKGTFESPEDAYWSSTRGKATWTAGSGSSGYYDVVLYRGDTEITAKRDYNGTSIDFYPYMTTKGRYWFKVRTVAHGDEQKRYGTHSSYVTSDDLYIEANEVSDGRGRNDGSSGGPGGGSSSGVKAGWVKEYDYWYYKYPDGSYKKNGWEYINNKWYLFDADGRMLTGWQKRNNSYYYLNPDGDMKTGWIKDGSTWYFLNTTENNQGAVLTNTWLKSHDGKHYYLNGSGAMCEGWTNIGGSWYYFYYGDGHLAKNTYIDTFYVNGNGVWVK